MCDSIALPLRLALAAFPVPEARAGARPGVWRRSEKRLWRKMGRAGEVEKAGRGLYVYPGKNGRKKETRMTPAWVGSAPQSFFLSNLSGGSRKAGSTAPSTLAAEPTNDG